jgi:hypothetical protein
MLVVTEMTESTARSRKAAAANHASDKKTSFLIQKNTTGADHRSIFYVLRHFRFIFGNSLMASYFGPTEVAEDLGRCMQAYRTVISVYVSVCLFVCF